VVREFLQSFVLLVMCCMHQRSALFHLLCATLIKCLE
jgi:hypothetical protein